MSTLRQVQITFDCGDPGAQAAFWIEVLGYQPPSPPPGFADWDAALASWGVPAEHRNDRSSAVDPGGSGPRLFFQKVPEGKVAKNRVHLDVRAAPGVPPGQRMSVLDGEARRLEALGARVVRRVEPDGAMEAGFIWMEDPEGNEFCLD